MILIKKVLNSSVILADDEGKEIIAFGKGIGYGKKAGEKIPDELVDKMFLAAEDKKTSQIIELVGEIPFEFFEISRDIILKAENELGKTLNSNIYLTLTDHLHFAIERSREGLVVANRLYWEIKKYYPKEFEIGKQALALLEDKYDIQLPKEEASNIAFHLINAQSDGSEANGFKYAKMISGIVNMVRYSIQKEIDTTSIHYSRFITHVRYFVERLYQNGLLEEDEDQLYEQMWILYPAAMEIAGKVKKYIEKVNHTTIPTDEIIYLGVHINRLMKHTT
ncbi:MULTISPECIES: PRD domain-containing protein [Enterococcus]|uniref:PRD domain-containing protein n=1 Tax=Enterococcus TaxID=1350 RepID=UPI000EF124E1|nr:MULTISPECIES: PRD domain-containing protein [Enterococcus]HCM86931.1 transcription antiterminator BglG [Enterococcus sp.]